LTLKYAPLYLIFSSNAISNFSVNLSHLEYDSFGQVKNQNNSSPPKPAQILLLKSLFTNPVPLKYFYFCV